MMGIDKRRVTRAGKKIFRRGKGINIVFGPKYIPLNLHLTYSVISADADQKMSQSGGDSDSDDRPDDVSFKTAKHDALSSLKGGRI
jgi:hypothetical protein